MRQGHVLVRVDVQRVRRDGSIRLRGAVATPRVILLRGGYLVLTGLYALVPHIRNLEPSLRKEKASRAADGATK
jgi:hypothetical protein